LISSSRRKYAAQGGNNHWTRVLILVSYSLKHCKNNPENKTTVASGLLRLYEICTLYNTFWVCKIIQAVGKIAFKEKTFQLIIYLVMMVINIWQLSDCFFVIFSKHVSKYTYKRSKLYFVQKYIIMIYFDGFMICYNIFLWFNHKFVCNFLYFFGVYIFSFFFKHFLFLNKQ